MQKQRLDQLMVTLGLVSSRSQAESWIKLGKVTVNGLVVSKPGSFIISGAKVRLNTNERYVSRAGLKLASVAKVLNIDFTDSIVLDVGSSTGGFTDYAVQHGARKVIAVDVGTNQLHATLRSNPQVELHEQTDIRSLFDLSAVPDIVLIDVSFISLRDILPHIVKLTGDKTQVIAMVKPQFEAGTLTRHKGVVKNSSLRRDILKAFEQWVRQYFVIKAKADSEVVGARGNRERFYTLLPVRRKN